MKLLSSTYAILFVVASGYIKLVSLYENDSPQRSESSLETYQPGQLLQSLDSVITDMYLGNVIAQTSSTPTAIQERVDRGSEEPELDDADDYDRAYDEFVRHYFTKAIEEDEVEQKDEEKLDSEKPKAASKCRKVTKNRQQCKICENRKSGEKTEECSYSKDYSSRKPKKGSVKESAPRGLKNTDQNSSGAQRTHEERKQIAGLCWKSITKDKICYECQIGEDEERLMKCLDKKKPGATADTKGKPVKLKDEQRRIYKRTVSFEYEKKDFNSVK